MGILYVRTNFPPMVNATVYVFLKVTQPSVLKETIRLLSSDDSLVITFSADFISRKDYSPDKNG